MPFLERSLPALVCLIVLVGVSACEVTNPLEGVNLILEVEDAAVELGSTGVSMSVRDGQTVALTESVGNELDVDAVELNEIKLEPTFFSFAPGKNSALQDTGTLTVLVSIGLPPGGPLYPLPPVVVTIVDNVVTDVQPRSISFLGSSYDVESIEDLIESLPAGERPNMADLGGLTIDETKDVIEEALANASGFLFSIVVQSDGVSGSLTLSEFSIDGRVTRGSE